MNIRLALLSLILCTTGAVASFRTPTASPRLAALGGTQACGAEDVDPLSGNPADLAGSEGIMLRAFGTRFYGLEELGHAELAGRARIGNFDAALGFRSFGFELYRETTLHGAVAFTCGESLQIGIGTAWLSRRIGERDNSGALDLSLGVVVRVSENLSLGAALRHLNAPRFGMLGSDRLEREPLCGIMWRALPTLAAQLSIRLPGESSPVAAAGLEYRPFPFLALRCGANTLDNALSGGLGIVYGDWRVDYALTESRNGLGTSHLLSLGYAFGSTAPEADQETVPLSHRIDVNSAPAAVLARLPGISRHAAGAIVRERVLRGPFTHIRELGRLRVIKPAALAALDERLAVNQAGEIALRLPGERNPALTLNGMEMRDLIMIGIDALAARTLILHRNARGGFHALEELARVPGIDAATRHRLQEVLRAE